MAMESNENIINSQDLAYILDSLQQEDDKPNNQIIENIIQNHLVYNTDTAHIKPFWLETDSTSKIPSIEEYPGVLNFSIKPDDSVPSTWEYSDVLGTLFINMNKALRMKFSVTDQYYGLYVRAVAVYADGDSMSDPVNRCPLHFLEYDPQASAHKDGYCQCGEFQYVGHVVRADVVDAIYCYNNFSERHSVLVPFSLPQSGDTSINIPYSFSCKTSCARGMNRRFINVVFTLENSKFEVIGRRLLTVKICSCPKRDMKRLEKDKLKQDCDLNMKPGKKLMPFNPNIHLLPPMKKIKLIPSLTPLQSSLQEIECLKGELLSFKEQVNRQLERFEETIHKIQCTLVNLK